MERLTINRLQSAYERAILLRQLFSGIVTGNIRQESIQAVVEHDSFRLQDDRTLMQAIGRLQRASVSRCKYPSTE